MVTKMEVKAYIGAVKKALRYVPEGRKIAKDLYHEVEVYLDQNPDATMVEVYNLFGAPEAIRTTLIADMEPAVVEKQIEKARYIRTVALVTAAILVVLFVLTMVGIIVWNYNSEPLFVTEDIFTY